jgi:hypothetical protein
MPTSNKRTPKVTVVMLTLPRSFGNEEQAKEFVHNALHTEWTLRTAGVPDAPEEPKWNLIAWSGGGKIVHEGSRNVLYQQ